MKKVLIFILLSLFLVACGRETEEVNYLDPIEVELMTNTELLVNEENQTQVLITQNEKPVSDASEVVFEIWQHGKPETYRKVEAKAKGEGIYEVTWTAEDEGVYYVFYHVTARGMHRMEKQQYVFGDVDVEKILATPDERPKKHMN